jgi:hypothetical protein
MFYGKLHYPAPPVISVKRAGRLMRNLVRCVVVSYIGKCVFNVRSRSAPQKGPR